MFKPSITQLLTALTEALNKKGPQEENPLATISIEERFQAFTETTPNLELGRVADALERIATALEKLTEETNQETNPTEKINWITLPDPAPVPAKPLPVEKIELPKPTQPAPKPPAVIVTPTQPKPKKPTQPAPNPEVTETNNVISGYFDRLSIKYEPMKAFENQQQLDKIALHLGTHFKDCEKIYRALKDIKKGETLNFSFDGFLTKEINSSRAFLNMLKKSKFVTTSESPDKKTFQINFLDQNNFIQGTWLESYARQKIEKVLKEYTASSGQTYGLMDRVRVSKDDWEGTELDVIFSVNRKIFWVEAKVCLTEIFLVQFLTRTNPLKLVPKKTLLITTIKNTEQWENIIQKSNGCYLTTLDDLEKTVKEMLGAE